LSTLFKINNPEVWSFLLKYTQTDPPDESGLRKNYIHTHYKEILNKIQVLCQKENIWVSIDKITIANVVIGV
jgi:hypothetical protein